MDRDIILLVFGTIISIVAYFLNRLINDFDAMKNKTQTLSERQSVGDSNFIHLEKSIVKIEEQLEKMNTKIDTLLKK
jgi:predicted PurR-regulated permease PerM